MNSVLILTPFFSPNVGGVETHLDDLVEVLKDQPFKSYVLTYQPLMSDQKAPSQETKGNVTITRIEWIRKLFYKLEPYPILDFLYLTPRLLIATFFFLLRHKDVKVIHAQGINAACIAVLLKPVFKTKVVISTHAVYEFQGDATLFAKVTKWIFLRSDKILSLLQHSKIELIKLGIPEHKITPYTYWINLQIFQPLEKAHAKQIQNWDPQKFHVLFVGRIFEKKGVIELVEAAKKLTDPSIQIHIIGTGPLEEWVKEQSQKIQTITFHGKVSNNELPLYFQAADTFIIPSTHEEGAGRVIMESLACGTPVIGANRGGIPEILDDSVGILIDVSPENIVAAIEKMHHKIKENPNMLNHCRAYAEERFSRKNAQLILDSYVQ